MQDVIQLVITKKVGEALALLGVRDYSQESIKEQILTLSNFVRDARLKAGEEDSPACQLKEICPNRQAVIDAPLRGSYRVLSYAAKRGQTDYKGLDGPARKKRSKAGRVQKPSAASVPPAESTSGNGGDTAAAKENDLPSEPPKNDGDTAAANKNGQSNKPSENEVDIATAENNDQPSEASKNDVDTATSKENDQSSKPTPRRDQPSDGPDSTAGNAAAQPHDEIHQIAAISTMPVAGSNRTIPLDNAAPPNDESEQSASATLATVGMDTALAPDIDCRASLEPLTPSIQNLFASALAMKAMETILLDCASLNYTLARNCWTSNTTIAVMTRTKDMRKYAEKIASWDYEKALAAIRNEHAAFANKDIQARYNKSIYWKIITKYAELLNPASLPTAKGRLDEFTVAEKTTTRQFMKNAGYGLSYTNQSRCRRFWKSLSDMREAGVDKILFYRTKEFDSFCEQHRTNTETDLVQTVLSWETVYGPHIEQLEERVKREGEGDRTGRSWLTQPHVTKRLNVPEASWNNARNVWFSAEEEEQFRLATRQTKATSDQLGGLLDIPAAEGGNQNKSIFVSLLPRDETFLSVRPIITIQEGDFLGIFGGILRYSENFDPMYGIRGPHTSFG